MNARLPLLRVTLAVALTCSCGKSVTTLDTPACEEDDPVFGGNIDGTGGLGFGNTGGSSGVQSCSTLKPSTAFPLIDNFEDGDTRVAAGDSNREGFWFYLNDGKGTFTHDATSFVPVPGGVGNSVFAAHFGGDGFTDWGFGVGTALKRRTVTHTCPADASLFAGVRFRARGQAGPQNEGHARVTLPLLQTMDQQWGGSCEAKCGDLHQRFVKLCPEWREYVLSFDDFQQTGWGQAVVFSPEDLIGLNFEILPNGNPGGFDNQPADVWIDDIRFVGEDELTPIEFECDAPPYLGLGGTSGGQGGAPP